MMSPYPPASMRAQVQRFLVEHGVRNTRVLVAVSGGADSTFLLWMMDHLARVLDLEIIALYVNHGVGREAEETHVRQWVHRLGRPLQIFRYHGPSPETNQEAFWRRLRQYAYHRALRKTGARWLLTGHQGTDLLETLMIQWIRGSGLRGLRSLLPRRGRVLRPLLRFTREEIREALEEAGIPYVEDPANRDLRYLRVRIRQEWLPRFRALRPGAEHRALTLLDRLNQVYQGLLWAGERLWNRALRAVYPSGVVLDRTVWTRYDREAWVERLRLRFPRLRQQEASALWRWIQEGGEGAFEGGYCVADAREVFLGWAAPVFPYIRLTPGIHTVEAWNLRLRVSEGPLPVGILGTGLPDVGDACIRPARKGEFVRGKAVEDWFRRLRLPRWKRKIWPVVEVSGVPVWMPGLPPLPGGRWHIRIDTKEWRGYALFDSA